MSLELLKYVHTSDQLKEVYSLTEEIISNLELPALNQLLEGTGKDADMLLDDISVEIGKALYHSIPIQLSEMGNLEKLTTNVDEILKILFFNYFVVSTLPDFEMNWHHIEWGNLVQIFPYLGVLAARDHSKSYTFSKAYPLWKLYRYRKKGDPNYIPNLGRELLLSKTGMIITSEFSLGETLLSFIKEEIEDNPLLNQVLYPGSRSEGWAGSKIVTKNGASLRIKSGESRMRGLHPTYIIVDDLLTDNVIYSKEQRQKYIDLFHAVIMNMIVPGGQVVVVGTPFHELDLYADLKKKPSWRIFEYPAIFPDGTILWENRHNFETLLRKRKDLGSIIFSREILVRPISSETSIFPYHIIKRAYDGMDKFTLVPNRYSFPKQFNKVVVGTDFAISSETGADAVAFVTLGIDMNTYWVINIYVGKGISYDNQMAILKNLNFNFQPDFIMIETNAMQKIFYQMAVDAGLPALKHQTGTDKYSLTEGLPALGVVFEQGRIKLPRGDQKSIDLTDALAVELNSYVFDDTKDKITSVIGHGDISMALWQAVRAAQYRGGDFKWDFI